MGEHKKLYPRFKRAGDGTLRTIVKVVKKGANYYERHKMAFRSKTAVEMLISWLKRLKYVLIDKPQLNKLNRDFKKYNI